MLRAAMPLQELLAKGARFGRNTTIVVVTVEESWVARCANFPHVHDAVAVLLNKHIWEGRGSIFAVSALAAAGIPTYLVKHFVVGQSPGRARSTAVHAIMR